MMRYGGEHSFYAKLYEGIDGYVLELSNNRNYQNKDLKLINDFENVDLGNVTGIKPWYSEWKNIVEVRIVNKIAPLTTENLFYALVNLKEIKNMENLDTSYVTDMKNMFNNCQSLESIDLSNFNTSNVTDMSFMFALCGVKSLDVSSFDTENVTNMRQMFHTCLNLEEIIGLNSFNTINATNMVGMFGTNTGTENKLTSLDLTSFDTRNVRDMSNMFRDSLKLTTIYVNKSIWKIAPNNSNMFKDCGTSNVTFV